MELRNQTYLGDCFEIMKSIPDGSIDAIITDPPYGINVSHWDKEIDIDLFTKEVKRILKPTGFYAFFGQMPTVLNWLNSVTQERMKYREHIIWVKRLQTPSKRLHRSQESIFIYGGQSEFYQTKGRYEDVKIPGILFDTISIEGFQRAYSALQSFVRTGKEQSCSGGVRQDEYKRFTPKFIGSRCPEMSNFTNVWSFLPERRAEGRSSQGITHHPTEKPILLIQRLVEMLTQENDLILDPFAGSGTLGVACLKTKRNYLLIEKEQDYYEILLKRLKETEELLSKEKSQLNLFDTLDNVE